MLIVNGEGCEPPSKRDSGRACEGVGGAPILVGALPGLGSWTWGGGVEHILIALFSWLGMW